MNEDRYRRRPDSPGAASGDAEHDLSQAITASQPTWNTGNSLFSPDISLDGSDSQYLASGSGDSDFTPNSSTGFSVSAWVNPSASNGGTVFSQDGSTSAAFSSLTVSASSTGQWNLSINEGGSTYDVASGGTVQLGLWTNLVLTYDGANGDDVYKLYANGVEVDYLQDITPPSGAGSFVLGARWGNGSAASFLSGQLADVQVWDNLAVPAQPATPKSAYVPIPGSDRILDTRSTSKIGSVTGPVAVGATVTIPIADDGGTTGAPLSATNVTSAVVAITELGGENGFLTAYPDGAPPPVTSTLNCYNNDTITNDVILPVGPDGKIDISNGCGGANTQLIIDLTGYFTTATSGKSGYVPLNDPARLFNINPSGTIGMSFVSGANSGDNIPADSAVTVTIAGNTTVSGLPSSGITAVALNIGANGGSSDNGWVAAYPDGTTRPANQSLLSFTGGHTWANTLIIPVGSDGKIDLYNGSGSPISLVGDLSGYFTTTAPSSSAPLEYYHPIDSTRILDTRQTSPLAANGGIQVVGTPLAIAADSPTLVLNITPTGEADSGDLKMYPNGGALPNTSIINFGAGQPIAGLGLINTASENAFIVQNYSSGTANVVLDTDGYFEP